MEFDNKWTIMDNFSGDVWVKLGLSPLLFIDIFE